MARRANVPGPPWPNMAFFYAMLFTIMFLVVGGLASNDSALTSGTLTDVSSPSFLGTAGTSLPTGWPDDDFIIDPNCDPKLAVRQVEDGDGKPDCPCCISRNGTHLEPFQTVSRPDRPTTIPTASFMGVHSMWEATVTIPGDPVPTESDLVDVDMSICVACDDEACFLGNPKGRRQIDDDSDSDDWPSSDDDSDDDPSTPNDLMAPSLTHPQSWEYGEGSWWSHMYNLVINRGARFGPRLQKGKVDPRLETYVFLSHASMTNFDRPDAQGNIIRADDGLAGGIIPIWGCTGIVVVSDRGAYTAHIWEAPTFITGPGQPQEDTETRQMHWDFRVNQFFAQGNRGVTSPPSPAIADLVKEGGPFAKDNYQWIQVHIFAVRHLTKPGPQYPQQMMALEEELKKYVGHVDERDFSRHLYTRRAPHREDATFVDSKEYYEERAGLQLVAWQYAPKEQVAQPAQEGKTQDMRAFRLWWNKRVMTTKAWCIPGTSTCDAPCTRDRPEDDPDTTTERGGGGQASGSGNQARRDLDIAKRPSSALSLVPRVDPPPRMPREFTEMFPGALTDPQSWQYGTLDWWNRMYTVAVRYGATGDPSQLLNIVSGDDYQANHCVYRDLDNLGPEGTGGGVTPLYGCSGLVVASNKGVYMGHFWEQPNFWPPPPNLQARKPKLYGDEKEIWTRRVTGMLMNGYEPYFDDQPWGPSLERIAGQVFRGNGVDWLKVWILTPDKSMEEVSGLPRYPTKYGYLLDDLHRFLGVDEEDVDLVTYVKYTTAGVSVVGSDRYYAQNPGIHMFVWQFAPDAKARQPGPGFMHVNAIRVFWDRREIFYLEWCPPGKDCSGQGQGSCSRRATAGPSGSQEKVSKRQDPADGQPADTPSPPSDEQTPPEDGPPPPAAASNTEAPIPAASTSPADSEIGPPEGAPLPIFLDDFTDPESWTPGEEAWWEQMQDAVTDEGAGAYEYFAPPDDFVNDHATFHEFGSLPFGTGIEPMWGCTGIVVMSDKGIYTARIWETPTFVAPKDPANKYTYPEDQVWAGRIEKFLLGQGFASLPEHPGHDVIGLSTLANSTDAFSPSSREWIHVQIITPEADGNKSEKTTPLYFKKVAKLRDDLVNILSIEKEDVKVKTYSSRLDDSARTTNSTSDPSAHKTNGTSGGMEEYFDEHRGSNMLGIMYVPKHAPENNETEAIESRGIRMWWDKEDYLTHLWCPPNSTVLSTSEATASSSSVICGSGSGSGSKSKPNGKKISGEVCQVILTPRLFPNQNMRVDLAVDFNYIPITKDGHRDMASAGQISTHTFATTMGGKVTIPGSDSGLPKSFTTYVGSSWERYLWDHGYPCMCDAIGCDVFSRECCPNGGCPEYVCNCAEPDKGGADCWPGRGDVAQCCLTKVGCGDHDLRRGPESDKEPNLPWESFEDGFDYDGENWSSGRIEDPQAMEYPPQRSFCQRGLSDARGYNDIKKFEHSDFSWERSTVCYFACEGTVTTRNSTATGNPNASANVTLPDLPSVPLADEDPDRYKGLSEPPYNPEVNGTTGNDTSGDGTWTTGTGPVPTNLF